MGKKYTTIDNHTPSVSEPATAYVSNDVLIALRAKLVTLVDQTSQVSRLQQCMDILSQNEMPCTYSNEEFKKEIALAEKEGFVSHADFIKSCKERWGVEL